MSRANQDEVVEKKTKLKRGKEGQELTFEYGFSAQDNVLEDDETLTDLGGVSEKAIRDGLLEEKLGNKAHSD